MLNSGPRGQRPSVVLLLGLLLIATVAAPALAADNPADPATEDLPEVALRLSPAKLEVPQGSGPSRHELRVDNLGSHPLEVVTQLADFTVTEDGTTQFLGPEGLSATAWANLDVDRFELAPGERRDVILTVEVPDDAEPGERYLSAIFTVPGSPGEGGNISVTHRVAVKLYINVPGERIEHIELGELSGPGLIDTEPAMFELSLDNRGNVHRRFEGDTQLLATSGGNDFAFGNFTVLGDSTRVVQAVWPDPPLLCWCTIEVEIDDGQGNPLVASTRVIAFPLRLSLALLTLIVGLAVVAIGRRRRRRAAFDRQLEAARREGAGTPSAVTRQPQRPPPTVEPPGPHEQPTPSPRPPAPAGPAEPFAYAAAATVLATSPSTPRTTELQPLDMKLFTAHGNQTRKRRRRRQR